MVESSANMMTAKKRVIVNADDFGLCETVNTAIISIFKAHNLNSTTMMVNMPGTLHAVELAKENPALQVGLHFCITEGSALTGVSTLTDREGKFLNRAELLMRLIQFRVKKSDIRNEFVAQLDKFDSFGIPISHIDSHQHLHMAPQVFAAITPLVESRELPMRIVCPSIRHSLVMKRPLKYFKQVVNKAISKVLKARFVGKSNDCLISIFDLDGFAGIDSNIYERLISETGDHEVVELMVHPFSLGKDMLEIYGDSLINKAGFLKVCELEYRCLSNKRVISDPLYAVIGYRDL